MFEGSLPGTSGKISTAVSNCSDREHIVAAAIKAVPLRVPPRCGFSVLEAPPYPPPRT